MGQNFSLPEASGHRLAELQLRQRMDVLLCIDEIFTALDMASPAVDQRDAARRFVQLIGESKFAAMAGIPNGTAQGKLDAGL